jgi:hypothetical protein
MKAFFYVYLYQKKDNAQNWTSWRKGYEPENTLVSFQKH